MTPKGRSVIPEKAISDKLADLVQETNGVIARAKKMLEALQLAFDDHAGRPECSSALSPCCIGFAGAQAQSAEMEGRSGNGAELQIRRTICSSEANPPTATAPEFPVLTLQSQEALLGRVAELLAYSALPTCIFHVDARQLDDETRFPGARQH
eukprot:1519160-Amphidinium_carterae.1